MRAKRRQQAGRQVRRATNRAAGVHIRAQQPGPGGALVVRRVARALVASIAALEIGMGGDERAHAQWRQQRALDHVEDRARRLWRDQSMRPRQHEALIWWYRRIG